MNKRIIIISAVVVAIAAAGFIILKKSESSNSNRSEVNASDSKNRGSEDGAIHISSAEFKNLVFNYEGNPAEWSFEGDLPCIVDFYADWCKPCQIAGPVLEELAKEYKGKINIYKIDTDEEKELAAAFNIQSIPTFLLCPSEGQPRMFSGIGQTPEQTKEIFRKAIEEVLLNGN